MTTLQPALPEVPAMFFGKHVFQWPVTDGSETMHEAMSSLKSSHLVHKELRGLLCRYPHEFLRYYSFPPLARDAAQETLSKDPLLMPEEWIEHSSLSFLSSFQRDDAHPAISFAVEGPYSLQDSEDLRPAVQLSREWYDCLADRGLRFKYDPRFYVRLLPVPGR